MIDCVVMKNSQTGKSRGFGFVKFADPAVLDVVLLNAPHWIDGRQASTQCDTALRTTLVLHYHEFPDV